MIFVCQGLGVRAWQLGIEMRPLFTRQSLWVYPVFGGAGASFGYWLDSVGTRQKEILAARRDSLLEKRARRAKREEESGGVRLPEEVVQA
jgi:hypothetical protein